MNDTVFRQFFGPSARHPRACVEASFPIDEATYNLAEFEAPLEEMGVRLASALPEGPLPLDLALAALARATLSSLGAPWTNRARGNGRAFVALSFPRPLLAYTALRVSLQTLLAGKDEAAASTRKSWAQLRQAIAETDPHGCWMLAAAAMFGREGVAVNATGSMYQVGAGAKGVHFFELGNQFDSLSGMVFARDKLAAIELLRRSGLPTTTAVMIRSRQQALQAAARIGTPCVVKPVGLGKGTGVSTGLSTDEQILAALDGALAQSNGRPAMIENHIEGFDHRMAVIGGELLWTYRRLPARVTGDGKSSVGDLIARENARRAAIRGGPEDYLCPIDPGEQLQRFIGERYGLALDDVPEKGREIELAGQANIAQGGVLEDVTASVHLDNRMLALKVARLFRMQALGIDFMTPDISRSWKEGGSAIIEVNGTPGIGGLPDAILVQRMLLPNRRSGQVPTVAAIGDEAFRARAADMLRDAFAAQKLTLATADYPGARSIAQLAGPSESASMIDTLLLDPDAQAVTVLCDPGQVARTGFPLRRCDLVLKEERGTLAWLPVQAALEGEVSAPEVAQAVARIARRYREPGEGGPLPVLEPVRASEDERATFTVRVWRTRTMPRAWFWEQVGVDPGETAGLTTQSDLLGAVRALADRALREGSGEGLEGEFAYSPLPPVWLLVTSDAEIALPQGREKEARAALVAAIRRVNQIIGIKDD